MIAFQASGWIENPENLSVLFRILFVLSWYSIFSHATYLCLCRILTVGATRFWWPLLLKSYTVLRYFRMVLCASPFLKFEFSLFFSLYFPFFSVVHVTCQEDSLSPSCIPLYLHCLSPRCCMKMSWALLR